MRSAISMIFLVEGMLILWINNRYFSERPTFDYHLRKAD